MSSPPRKKEKTEEEVMRPQPDGVIQFEIDKVSTLDEEYRHSTEIDVKGVPWRASVNNDGEFSVQLFCMNTQSTLWNVDVQAEFNLLHPDGSKRCTSEESFTFDHAHNRWYLFAMDWDDVVEEEEGCIKDDKITVEVRFWITKMRGLRAVPRIDFTNPDEPRHDVALMIEGEKIYVSKQILAAHSSVFNVMFYGNFSEKNKKEIQLTDLDREEFLEMLHVIYPSCKKITEASAEYLLKLGDQFQMAYVIDRVEEFLIASDDVSNSEKLRIAEKFKLFGLQEHCFSELKSEADFNEVKESSIYGDLSLETKALLFERLLSTVLGTSRGLASQVVGQRALKSFNDTYIRAWQGPRGNAPWYVDLAPHCRMCEHWTITEQNGKVVLRAYVFNFLRARPDGRVDLADAAQSWEMWTPRKNGDGTWSFRSHHGTWLSASRADGIVCTKPQNLRTERFRLESW